MRPGQGAVDNCRGVEMATKGGQEKMAVVNLDWFFTRENLEKFSDEELESILRELQEIQIEKRGGRAGDAG
jgi:hypothetical protein